MKFIEDPIFQEVQAIFFDLDGTLVDSAPDLAAAANKMRVNRGLLPYDAEIYRSMVGAGARGMLDIAFGIQPENSEFTAMKEEFFLNYAECLTVLTVPFHGVSEVLNELMERQFQWGVVTNKSERFAFPLTQGMPLFRTMSVVIGGDTTSYAKPHPEPLLEAARRLGVQPKHCIYVGDDERDILAGKAAGMRTVAAAYGYLGRGADVLAWRADAIIKNPLELLSLLPAGTFTH